MTELTSHIEGAADDATHAVVDTWESHGLEVSNVDLESAMFAVNDLLTAWMRDNLRLAKAKGQ